MAKNVFMNEKWPDNILSIVAPELKLPQTWRQKRGFEKAISLLTKREQEVLYLRARDHLSLDKAAKELGITRERVRQVQNKVVRKLSTKPLNDFILYDTNFYKKLKPEACIEELGLPVRIRNCLRRKQLLTIKDVADYFQKNTYESVRYMGEKSYLELCKAFERKTRIILPKTDMR